MRHRNVLIALACAALAAVGGTLAGTLSIGAAQTRLMPGGRPVASPAAAHAAKATPKVKVKVKVKVRTRVIRGPRGLRGPQGLQGPQGKTGPQGPASPPDAIAVPITLSRECDETAQTVTLTPSSSAGTRTVADVTTMQGEGTNGISSNQRMESYG